MAEYLFVGGPWDGQRREVADDLHLDWEPPNVFEDYCRQAFFSGGPLYHYRHKDMRVHAMLAALLANYRPHADRLVRQHCIGCCEQLDKVRRGSAEEVARPNGHVVGCECNMCFEAERPSRGGGQARVEARQVSFDELSDEAKAEVAKLEATVWREPKPDDPPEMGIPYWVTKADAPQAVEVDCSWQHVGPVQRFGHFVNHEGQTIAGFKTLEDAELFIAAKRGEADAPAIVESGSTEDDGAVPVMCSCGSVTSTRAMKVNCEACGRRWPTAPVRVENYAAKYEPATK